MMVCPNCGVNTQSGKFFCSNCGAILQSLVPLLEEIQGVPFDPDPVQAKTRITDSESLQKKIAPKDSKPAQVKTTYKSSKSRFIGFLVMIILFLVFQFIADIVNPKPFVKPPTTAQFSQEQQINNVASQTNKQVVPAVNNNIQSQNNLDEKRKNEEKQLTEWKNTIKSNLDLTTFTDPKYKYTFLYPRKYGTLTPLENVPDSQSTTYSINMNDLNAKVLYFALFNIKGSVQNNLEDEKKRASSIIASGITNDYFELSWKDDYSIYHHKRIYISKKMIEGIEIRYSMQDQNKPEYKEIETLLINSFKPGWH